MKVLAQFKSIPNYVDFCLPELKSLLSMHGLDWREVFKHEFIAPSDENSEANFDTQGHTYAYSSHVTKNRQQKRQAFPQTIADVRHTSFRRFPFMYLELPNAEISQSIISRSVMLDVFIEAISDASTYDELVKTADMTVFEKHNIEGKKLLFEVDPYNSHFTQKEVIDRIEIITESFKMKGKIDLKKPEQRFWIMERHVDPYTKQTDSSITTTLLDVFFGIEIGRSKSSMRISAKENFLNKYDLKNRAYLGPTSTDNSLSFLMCNQGRVESGSLVFDPFVGSGSLLIPPSHYGAICYGGDLDPRVLHGFGVGRLNKQSKFYQANVAYCTDMKPKIMLNYEQYGLPKPTVVRMDCVNTNFRALEIFDAIICDPPYGFRAMTRTAGNKDKKKKDNNNNNKNDDDVSVQQEEVKEAISEKKVIEEAGGVQEVVEAEESKNSSDNHTQGEQEIKEIVEQISEKVAQLEVATAASGQEEVEGEEQASEVIAGDVPRAAGFAQTITVSVEYIVNGLVNLANRVLVPGGRLVFLYPIERHVYNKQGLAGLNTPNFRLLDYSENPLSDKKSRILVTLEKILPSHELKAALEKSKEEEEEAVVE